MNKISLFFNNLRTKQPVKMILIILCFFMLLATVFLITFYLSYNEITKDRDYTKEAREKVQKQQIIIEGLQKEIKDKQTSIRKLESDIVKYKNQIRELKEKEEYAKLVADELNRLQKESELRAQAVYNENPYKSSNGNSGILEVSEVQNDIYIKEAR